MPDLPSTPSSQAFAGLYAGKTVFLTGHTGFKGAWLAHWLLKLGARVHGFALTPPTSPALFDLLGLAGRLEHQMADLRDAAAVKQAVAAAQPDFVFHLAAQAILRASYDDPVETYATNVMGTLHVLEALRELKKPCAAVVVTTDKCYENREWVYGYREEDPLGGYDPYSSSKAAVEIAVSAWRRSFFGGHPVAIATARAGNVIGGGDWAKDRIVPDCVRTLQANRPVPVRNRTSRRPWQHVLEPLSGYLWLAARMLDSVEGRVSSAEPPFHKPLGAPASPPASSQRTDLPGGHSDAPSGHPPLDPQLASAFNFGPTHESNRTVEELVLEVLKHWPGRWEDKSDPNAVHEARLLQLATDKAHALLGWSPVWDFPMAIEQTVGWYRRVAKDSRAAVAVTSSQIEQYEADAAKAGLPWAPS
jgi:CDP-glucose 4,6-dehydratase